MKELLTLPIRIEEINDEIVLHVETRTFHGAIRTRAVHLSKNLLSALLPFDGQERGLVLVLREER